MHGGYLPPHFWSESQRDPYDGHTTDGWYFYDECEQPRGPYQSEAECRAAQKAYEP